MQVMHSLSHWHTNADGWVNLLLYYFASDHPVLSETLMRALLLLTLSALLVRARVFRRTPRRPTPPAPRTGAAPRTCAWSFFQSGL